MPVEALGSGRMLPIIIAILPPRISYAFRLGSSRIFH
jgi:hypothetical protein